MRCHQVRRRLIASRGMVGETDREMARHLRECAACVAFARAERALCSGMKEAAIDDITDDVPFSALKTRVNARADHTPPRTRMEVPIMSAVIRQIKRRPRVGITLGIAALVLAFVTFFPFSIERTIGYEVAFAGINKDLALDNERLHELMAALGIEDANVEVSDCDKTCAMKISDLKTEGDVRVVIKAFEQLGHCELKGVRIVSGDLKKTILDMAKGASFILERESSRDSPNDIRTKLTVVNTLNQLDSIHEGHFTIWTEKDAIIYSENDPAPKDSGAYTINLADLAIIDQHAEGPLTSITINRSSSDNVINFTVDGRRLEEIDLGDPDVVDRLKALGYELLESVSPGGEKHLLLYCREDGSWATLNFGLGSDDGGAALKETPANALPDGYELRQNYPNPFNPDTKIAFGLPESQHVKIDIINVNGQTVRTLLDEQVPAGMHVVQWDSADDNGNQVASGIYFYRLTAGDVVASKKMMLLK